MLQLLRMGSVFQYTFQQGQPPLLPSSMQHGGHASRGVWSPVNRSHAGISAWLNLKCMSTLYNYTKRGWNKLPTRRSVPRGIQEGDFVLEKTLSFQPDSRGKRTPNYDGACAMTLVTTNVDKPACRCSQEILSKYTKIEEIMQEEINEDLK